jgi:alanine racemase
MVAMEDNSYNCVTISSAALQHNYNYIKSKVAADVKVMAMVKADGYGHSMIQAAKAFADVGCDCFGVAELGEAVKLRKAGISGRIFVMLGFEDDEVGSFFEHELTPVVYNYNSARSLSDKALHTGVQIGVHIKVDTGMGRLGVMVENLAEFVDTLEGLQGISIAGIMSHFPESDNPESGSTEKGFAAFSRVCTGLKNRIKGVCHIANSGAVLNFPNTHCDMVRAGIALYGYHPAGLVHCDSLSAEGLIPAMSFSSKVLQVKTVPEGTGISYGLTYITHRETRIAVLPVGYEDGYSRILSNRGEVLIRGQRALIRGRICMNICMVDVTDISEAAAGDDAVFLGTQGAETITADDIAEKMGSISYEVLCLLGNNNQRVYRE